MLISWVVCVCVCVCACVRVCVCVHVCTWQVVWAGWWQQMPGLKWQELCLLSCASPDQWKKSHVQSTACATASNLRRWSVSDLSEPPSSSPHHLLWAVLLLLLPENRAVAVEVTGAARLGNPDRRSCPSSLLTAGCRRWPLNDPTGNLQWANDMWGELHESLSYFLSPLTCGMVSGAVVSSASALALSL